MPTAFAGPLITVIDVETTGLFPNRHDRVVEIAAVTLRPGAGIEREWCTLVNPQRDIGPSSIHGLRSQDILSAPTFAEAAHHLLDAIHGCAAIAGHNVRFDHAFMQTEFGRMGINLPACPTLCTMQLAGYGSLQKCCEFFDVPFDGQAHSALADARATAHLLLKLLEDDPAYARSFTEHQPVAWPAVAASGKSLLTREQAARLQQQTPTFLQRLVDRVHEDELPCVMNGAVMAYGALLDRVLEDRRIDDAEADALVEMATQWGLSRRQIEQANQNYLQQLVIAALADGIVTASEKHDLSAVARLLGISHDAMEQALNDASQKLSQLTPARQPTPMSPSQSASGTSGLTGQSVCFTGELECTYYGEVLTRDRACELAQEAGLIASPSVTKKLNILVLADPHTQSSKAKKAKTYGTRIMQERVFWNAIGVKVD